MHEPTAHRSSRRVHDPCLGSCGSSISPTSGFPSSVRTESSRWRRVMRWRARGHEVHLVVRPTRTRRRAIRSYYGLPKRAPGRRAGARTGPQLARRLGYLACAAGRVAGAGRADIVMTRDLGGRVVVVRLPSPAFARRSSTNPTATRRKSRRRCPISSRRRRRRPRQARAPGEARILRLAARRRLRHDHRRPGGCAHARFGARAQRRRRPRRRAAPPPGTRRTPAPRSRPP